MAGWVLRKRVLAALAAGTLLQSCGGGGGSSSQQPAPPPPAAASLARVSAASIFVAGCNGAPQSGTLYVNGPVEPQLAVNPTNQDLVGVWQQDRWSTGGAQGLMTGVSSDGGKTWSRLALPFSHCAGGNAANGADYDRSSDPWVTFSPNGVAYQIALSFSGDVMKAGSSSALLVSRSADGGTTWSAPTALIRDGAQFFNDKEAISADSGNPQYVYAVWDRLASDNTGPTYLARTADGGASWEAARAIYDPGVNNQTIGNQIVTLPGGKVVLLFTEIDQAANGTLSSHFSVLRSTDHGSTWMLPPVQVAASFGVGSSDPKTGAPIRDGTGLAAIAVGADGRLAVTWQDARNSGGNHDGILLALSTDSGATWSLPVQINEDPSVQAFTPAVRIAADGTIGVSYFDFHDDNANRNQLLTDYWLSTSRNGSTWTARRISGPFDLTQAPQAQGYFLGDYQALAASGTDFVPFFAQTDSAEGLISRIFTTQLPFSAAVATVHNTLQAKAVPAPVSVTPELAARVSEAIRRSLRENEPPRSSRALRRRR